MDLEKTKNKSGDSELNTALLYLETTDFSKALTHLHKASETFYGQKNYSQYLRCLNHMVRIYAEQQEFDKVSEVKDKFQDLIVREKVDLKSRNYYFLGQCRMIQGQKKMALEYFEKALDLAVDVQSREDMCYALIGLAILQTSLGRYEKALKDLETITKLTSGAKKYPQVEIAYYVQKGTLFSELKEYEKGLEHLWKAYELLKENKSLYMYIQILYAIGSCYLKKGDIVNAKTYLLLAEKVTDPNNLKNVYQSIKKALWTCSEREETSSDMLIDYSQRIVIEKQKGKIDFKNQFILLDLLKLFTQNPGEVYSKKQLAEVIWNQNYDSQKHDNKIYVTIKRLRKMIEPKDKSSKYIFRTKSGYYFNQGVRVTSSDKEEML